eukprot:TRINITY_DN10716_c0_g1_i1.p1 TRINITY_DN10716_c0_g1~~TRINITY_DN10716_c0_g1_i1.p1  ORF type:complete len:316 (-),score=40.69 TRINITY_DN10716_c0_g1_i1:120-1067(-)
MAFIRFIAVVLGFACGSFAQSGLYGIKLHTVLGRWDSSINTVDPNSGLVTDLAEVQLFSKTYYPIQNGLAAQESGNSSRLFQLFQTSSEGEPDPMATIAWPNITISFSSGAPQGVQYICYDHGVSNSTLFGVAGSFQGNASLVEVDPVTGVTTQIVTLPVTVPVLGALDSRRHVLYIVAYKDWKATMQEILAISLPSGRILSRSPLKRVVLSIVCDSSTGELFGIASEATGLTPYLVQLAVNGTAHVLGQALPASFGTTVVGAINSAESVAYFVGQVGASDSLFSLNCTDGAIIKIAPLNYGDGGNLVSLVYADL